MTSFTSKSQQTYEWRDVCVLCEAVVKMPPDGGPADHICLRMHVPWQLLADRGVVSRAAANQICADLTVVEDYEDWSGGPTLMTEDHPSRIGPFLPWEPPPPLLLSDLLQWTALDLVRNIRNVGSKSVKGLATWLEKHGYFLHFIVPPALLKAWMIPVIVAKDEALPVERRTLREWEPALFSPLDDLRTAIQNIEWEARQVRIERRRLLLDSRRNALCDERSGGSQHD